MIASVGMGLEQNDRVATQSKSYVRFQMNDGSIMTLAEKGDMSLEPFH